MARRERTKLSNVKGVLSLDPMIGALYLSLIDENQAVHLNVAM